MAIKVKTKKKKAVQNTGIKAFRSSLKEAVKFAKGHKAKVKVEPLMIRVSKEDVKRARKTLGVSQPKFANLIGYSPESVKKWERDMNPVPGGVARWIIALRIHPTETKELLFKINSLR